MYAIVRSGNELYHHGVKGQRWGIRRYQNYDGTLTAAGRRREGATSKQDVQAAKARYKQANREYSSAFYNAYNRNLGTFSPFKSHREASQKRWDEAYEKAGVANKAKQEYKDTKRREKLTRYADKLERRAGRKTNRNLENTEEYNRRYQDMKKNGRKSLEWEEHIRSKYLENLTDDDGYERNPGVVDFLNAGSHYLDRIEFNTHMESLKEDRNSYAAAGRQWSKRTENLMNYKISDLSTKKEIKDIYKGKHS